jgi:hypothetical protein
VVRESRPAGFVLVGVLMFILVLTILGLTLFSLGSYESQFFFRSNDDQTARYAALSGIERAKFALSNTGSLRAAQDLSGVPIDSLVYTVAKQGPVFDTADSMGAVSWNSDSTVWIRSLAVVNGQRALIEARFSPSEKAEHYRRLFSLSSPNLGLDVAMTNGTTTVGPQVLLYGALSQASTNTAFLATAGVPPNPYSTGDTLSPPNIKAFFAKHWNAPGTTVVWPRNKDDYDLDASGAPDQIGFFETPASLGDDPNGYWSLNADYGHGNHNGSATASITVHGTCIWMFDRGVRWYKRLTVIGTPSDALILVADSSYATTENDDAILFKSGIAPTPGYLNTIVPIILVTSQGVGIQYYVVTDAATQLSYLSVYAAACDIVGPIPPNTMDLVHSAAAPQDKGGGLIDRLALKGLLPNTTSGTAGDFTPKPRTWREIKSSDGY